MRDYNDLAGNSKALLSKIVRTTPQDLTPEEKEQAAENIGIDGIRRNIITAIEGIEGAVKVADAHITDTVEAASTLIDAKADEAETSITEKVADAESDIDEKAAEAIASIPEDYTDLTNEVGGLKQELEEISDYVGYEKADIEVNWVEGKGYNTSVVSNFDESLKNYTSLKCAKIFCFEGDEFYLTASSDPDRPGARIWAFFDENGNRLSVALQDAMANNLLIEAPANTSKLFINAKMSEPASITKKVDTETIPDRLEKITKEVIDNGTRITEIDGLKVTNWIKNKAINVTTSIVDITTEKNYPTLQYCILPCTEGDIFTIRGRDDISRNGARLWCFVDANNGRVSLAPTDSAMDMEMLIAPTGAKKLIVNTLVDDGDVWYGIPLSKKIADSKRKPMIVFIDDDGQEEDMHIWEEICDSTGIRPTIPVITGRVGLSSNMPQDWTLYERLSGKGFEFVSHTHNHVRLFDKDTFDRTHQLIITQDELEMLDNDFKLSTTALREHGFNHQILVYPHTKYAPEALDVVRKYFVCGITANQLINVPPIIPFEIVRHTFIDENNLSEITKDGVTYTVYEPKSVNALHALIDETAEKRGLLIFMCHFRNDYPSHYQYNSTFKDRIVDFAKYACSKGCEITTMGKAYDAYKNLLDIGKVTDSTYYVVSCDGKTYKK